MRLRGAAPVLTFSGFSLNDVQVTGCQFAILPEAPVSGDLRALRNVSSYWWYVQKNPGSYCRDLNIFSKDSLFSGIRFGSCLSRLLLLNPVVKRNRRSGLGLRLLYRLCADVL